MARKKADVGDTDTATHELDRHATGVLRALVASMPTGLSSEQLVALVPECELPAMMRAGLVDMSVRQSSLYLPSAYGRAWLAVRG